MEISFKKFTMLVSNLIKEFKSFLKDRTKILGFNSFINNFLPSGDMNKIFGDVYKDELKKPNRTKYERIYERHTLLVNCHNKLLKKMLDKKLLRIDQFVLMKTLRLIFNILGFIKIPFYINKKFFLQLSKGGNIDSRKIFVMYTKNKARDKVFNDNSKFCMNDYLVDDKPENGYEIINTTKVNARILFKCFFIKLKFYFLSVEDIIHPLIAEYFLKREFKRIGNEKRIIGALIREGPVPISRVLIEVCNEFKIKTSIFYTQLILPTLDPPQIEIVPTKASKFILNSNRFKPSGINENHEVYCLDGYPFENWNEYAKNIPTDFIIGLQLGDDFNRWSLQKKIDTQILNVLKEIGIKRCIARHHPYELAIPERVSYYKNLIKEFPFVHLDNNKTHENFLENISMMISYVPSTLVQQALLYKRQVIVFRKDKDFMANSSAINISSGLGTSVIGKDELKNAITNFKNMNDNIRNENWKSFLNELGIDKFKEISMNDVLDICYAKEISE